MGTAMTHHESILPRSCLSAGWLVGVCLSLAVSACWTGSARAQAVADSTERTAASSPFSLSPIEIRGTGSVRLSELFRMIPGMTTWSSDRYTLRMVGSGSAGLQTRGPAVSLDGMVIPSFFLDRQLTESMPASPMDADHVTFDPWSTSRGSGRTSDGVIRVSTPMLDGWQIRGAVALVNETGDPGPAKHLDARIRNVDRSGPASALRIGWGNGSRMIVAGLQTDLHHLTDELISGRVRRTYAEFKQPVIVQYSPFIRLRSQGAGHDAQLAAGRSWRKDFVFHESAGWEWPVRWQRDWAAMQTRFRTGGIDSGVRADGWAMRSKERPSFIRLPAGPTLAEASASLFVADPRKRWELSGGMRGMRLEQAGNVDIWSFPFAGASIGTGSGVVRWTVESQFLWLGQDVLQDRPWSMQLDSGLDRTVPEGMSWRLSLSVSSGHFPEAGQLEMWARAGWELGEWMTLPPLDSVRNAPTAVQGAFLASRPMGGNWVGWFALESRWMNGLLLQDRLIDQRYGVGPLLPEWQWAGGHGGWLFARTIGVQRIVPERIQIRGHFQFHHVASNGDDVFFRAMTGYPRNRVWVSAAHERSGGIRWYARAGYISAWTWPQYVKPARRSLPANLIIDATIGKTLFSGHVGALISLLNLPDRMLFTHPSGVDEQMAVRLTMTFSSRR